MADDAGFAVALTIRERLINDTLLLAYAGGTFPRTLNLPLPDGPPNIDIAPYLAPARISCGDDGSLSLAVHLWGPLTIVANGASVTHTIDGHLTVAIQPHFVISGTNLVLSPAAADVTVTDWNFTVIDPTDFPADIETYLHGGLFRNRLAAALGFAISHGLVPAIDLSFLQSVVFAVDMVAAARVRAGVLLVGLSVHSAALTIVGDPDLLFDFARGNDIAAATNAAAIPLVLADVATAIAEQVTTSGATLHPPISMTAEDGQFRVAATASNSEGTVHFSFAIVPSMFHTTPGAYFTYLKKPVRVKGRTFAALGFTPADIHVDVSKAFWLDIVEVVAGIFTFGVAAVWIEEMLQSVAAQLGGGIAAANQGPLIPRVRRSTPQNLTGVILRVEITAYDITTDGIYMGLTVATQPPPTMLIGPTSIPSNMASQSLNYAIRLPLDVHDDDPRLRIQWTVFDPNTAHVLANSDGAAAGRTSFDVTPVNLGQSLRSLGITCRVYRQLGATVTDLVNEAVTLTINGPSPSGAYIRWWYDVKNPQVTYSAAADEFSYAGEAVQRRHSNFHRADRPCKNARKSSRYTYQDEKLDSLPFNVHDIALHRKELCDYCFYGGPAGMRPAL